MNTNKYYIEVGGKCGNYFARNMIYDIKDRSKAIADIINKTNSADAYYCTYVFDDKTRGDETKYYSAMYFDIDGDIGDDTLFDKTRTAALSLITVLNTELRLRTDEMKIYFSGSKGFHIMIDPVILGIKPCKKLNMAYKCFVSYIKTKIENQEYLDTKIYDSKRLIRIPNTVNAKTGLYKIPITYSELRTITRSSLIELAKKQRAEKISHAALNNEAATRFIDIVKNIAGSIRHHANHGDCKIPDSIQKLPVCTKYLLSTPADKGERNNTLALISSILVQNGYIGDRAFEIMYAWNERNPEPLSDEEIKLTYNSVEKMARNGRGYGCTSIRERNLFAPRQICINCKIFQNQRRGINNG